MIARNPNIEFLFIIYIRNIWSRYTSYGIIKCNEKLAFGSEKRVPVQKRMGIINSEYTFTNRCIWRKAWKTRNLLLLLTLVVNIIN